MEPFLGMVVALPYPFAPRGWLPCDGRLLSIQQNTALFSLLGNNFGGDGMNNFGLPKLAPLSHNLNYYIATEGMYPSRN